MGNSRATHNLLRFEQGWRSRTSGQRRRDAPHPLETLPRAALSGPPPCGAWFFFGEITNYINGRQPRNKRHQNQAADLVENVLPSASPLSRGQGLHRVFLLNMSDVSERSPAAAAPLPKPPEGYGSLRNECGTFRATRSDHRAIPRESFILKLF